MKKRILLIEDDVTTIDIYESILGDAGFEVETLMFGKEGLARLKEIKEGKREKPDLVLLDLLLSDINGMKILEEAKKERETKSIPFLVLTNYLDPGAKEIGKKLGAKNYIVKTDITPSKLLKLVKEYSR